MRLELASVQEEKYNKYIAKYQREILCLCLCRLYRTVLRLVDLTR